MKKTTALALLLVPACATAEFQKSETDKWFICEHYARAITTTQLAMESSANDIREIKKSGKKPSRTQIEVDLETQEWSTKTIAQDLTIYRQLDCPIGAIITGMACANDAATVNHADRQPKLIHCFSLVLKDIQADAR